MITSSNWTGLWVWPKSRRLRFPSCWDLWWILCTVRHWKNPEDGPETRTRGGFISELWRLNVWMLYSCDIFIYPKLINNSLRHNCTAFWNTWLWSWSVTAICSQQFSKKWYFTLHYFSYEIKYLHSNQYNIFDKYSSCIISRIVHSQLVIIA